ncbi:hypothetical protein QJS04_geneDACA016078 [Acorus gramineus]|uniref:Neprosin PEP catalytic domain-containing protein n=1 Tax=Acorus gramineus TaxID=55184 RepID=A0AAV9BF17_ACOGR|nr:hypothetical protein QJS04_geneDACA016078 [Acorus gramineus]
MASSGFILIIFVVVVIFSIGNYVVNGRLILSKEEDQKLERELKRLNKPAIKSIHKEDGEIFDCVNIYKQPSLDHPLLKNHSIQMEPSSYPTFTVYKSFSINKFQNISIEIDGCPEGTVLIRRTSKEELISTTSRDIYGAKAAINVYGLREIKSPQSTHAQIWVISFKTGLQTVNTIQAGWHVYPEIYGDSLSRFFVYWTDRSTGNWWLTMGPNGTRIGYWPKGLFTWLSEKAHGVIWGGAAAGPKNGRTPPMGSGHFANLSDGKAAYFKQTEVIYTPGGGFTPIIPSDQTTRQDAPKCYTVTAPEKVPNVGYHFNFGGPGGC